MCVGIGQSKLKKDKEDKPLKDLSKALDEIRSEFPTNYKIHLFSHAGIIRQGSLDAHPAQFAWVSEKANGGTWPVFNVRVEGGWKNKSNDPDYKGPYDVFYNPYVKDFLPKQRCIVPCDFYIEQPTDKKIRKKFLIKKQDDQALFLAGVYRTIKDEITGSEALAFCLLTTAHHPLNFKIGHHRSPVILSEEQAVVYLQNSTKGKELLPFFRPYHSNDLEAYEVGLEIAKRNDKIASNDSSLIRPLGPIIKIL